MVFNKGLLALVVVSCQPKRAPEWDLRRNLSDAMLIEIK